MSADLNGDLRDLEKKYSAQQSEYNKTVAAINDMIKLLTDNFKKQVITTQGNNARLEYATKQCTDNVKHANVINSGLAEELQTSTEERIRLQQDIEEQNDILLTCKSKLQEYEAAHVETMARQLEFEEENRTKHDLILKLQTQSKPIMQQYQALKSELSVAKTDITTLQNKLLASEGENQAKNGLILKLQAEMSQAANI